MSVAENDHAIEEVLELMLALEIVLTLRADYQHESREKVLGKIDTLISDLLSGIVDTGVATVKLSNRRAESTWFDDKSLIVSARDAADTKQNVVTFPGTNILNSWRFAVLMRTLDIISESLTSGKIVTKRDIYYRETWLFKNQAIVDRIVDDIGRTLNVPRAALGIVSAQKGLACGTFCMHKKDGTLMAVDGEIQLIPPFEELKSIDVMDIDFVLVIEKEAVFRSLCSAKFYNRPDIGRSILVTGKGYPDLAARQFISHIAASYPGKPLFGAFDSDPYGVDIMCTYKFGSRAMAHENSHLTAIQMEWVGVNVLEYEDGWTKLSVADRKKALKMLSLPWMETDAANAMRLELQRMLFLGRKAEMNVVGTDADGVIAYLAQVIKTRLDALTVH
ncbi:Spo11/DNA topoisomerase VI subunit A [Lipomyces tetrasporus]|uniref:DNA topoisomerase (ATP-hydrolyzing) n=1 Tax=Lipomyces tetrasporus TaxID=54092 RepID=A0AAD7QYW4_9ASCO|nr:Spo11/DNA topoisomerase VI subunit A [Lipomyces tetrasporus]KAJ8103966.1 Spo11/DNA topoisomerase VI subunit A [Lipomyces tetrasporus]